MAFGPRTTSNLTGQTSNSLEPRFVHQNRTSNPIEPFPTHTVTRPSTKIKLQTHIPKLSKNPKTSKPRTGLAQNICLQSTSFSLQFTFSHNQIVHDLALYVVFGYIDLYICNDYFSKYVCSISILVDIFF